MKVKILFLLLLLLPLWIVAEESPLFTDIIISKDYEQYLLADKLLMTVCGAKIFKVNGKIMVVSVASTAIKDSSAQDRLRQIDVCKARATAQILTARDGIQVVTFSKVEEKTVISIENSKETGQTVIEMLNITKTTAEGYVRYFSVIGTWKSDNKDTFYLAIGGVIE